ncbi:MAG: hypothetical protein KGO96_14270 [Elusimicrobia bacterium]|nr:hypothetical protein [Elusimicrobiota bacterium]MDE2427060.1 hypothetical protein [Elusimicrobiota bacterium]
MKKTRKAKTPPLVRNAERAMRIAVSKVVKDHRRRREPLVLWEKGRVVKVAV